MTARRHLSIEDVFKKQKYRNIMYLISTYSDFHPDKKLKFIHLRYALCKNPGLNLDNKLEKDLKDFFNNPFHDRLIKDFNKQYKKGIITKQELEALIKQLGETELDRLKKYGWLTDETKFSTFQTLSNALARIEKLGLINRLNDKKGHKYYMITERGLDESTKYFIRWYMDNYLTGDKLEQLRYYAMILNSL